ncbi:Cyclic nucleotide-binding protein [Pseudocohnilembus persalinus]|uniref:Cyclic nucleotide-binding protein n=1 Tax=Pseudocohnilembus persalinus TaxID=266149 RepID=A0A0V0QY91_PSEPJ|nr:Cyclic nucleotide-binding protein [Pseudocohnilembus persalinus]|eukprot:KRX07308.1 Cyclic nucleotide-binding protein [Pseudocohnilembus persalinus]
MDSDNSETYQRSQEELEVLDTEEPFQKNIKNKNKKKQFNLECFYNIDQCDQQKQIKKQQDKLQIKNLDAQQNLQSNEQNFKKEKKSRIINSLNFNLFKNDINNNPQKNRQQSVPLLNLKQDDDNFSSGQYQIQDGIKQNQEKNQIIKKDKKSIIFRQNYLKPENQKFENTDQSINLDKNDDVSLSSIMKQNKSLNDDADINLNFDEEELKKQFERQQQKKKITEVLNLNEYNLTGNSNFIFFVAHYLACSFYFVARQVEQSGSYQETWISKNGFQTESNLQKYIDSLYFQFISMSTVGYGDISPVSTPEKIFTIITTIFSSGIFAYILNVVTQIFQNIDQKQNVFKKNKNDILMYLKQRQISNDLQLKVVKYFESQFKMEEIGINKSNKINNLLSLQLIQDVKKEFNIKILRSHSIFHSNFSEPFLQELTLSMKEQYLAPDELLFDQDCLSPKLCFIISGSIGLFNKWENKNQEQQLQNVCNFKKDEILAIKNFIVQKPLMQQARSLEITQILIISNEQFLKTLKQYPADFERYQQIQDEINLEERLSIQKKMEKCKFCNHYGHLMQMCPFLHVYVDKKQVLNKKYMSNKLSSQQDSIPYDFYETIQAFIQDQFNEQLNDQFILQLIPSIIIDKNFEDLKIQSKYSWGLDVRDELMQYQQVLQMQNPTLLSITNLENSLQFGMQNKDQSKAEQSRS